METIWTGEVKKRLQFDKLNEDIKTDVLIIGGGLSGILCAYMLKTNGVDCALAEADRICNGVTGGTTAKITFQHGLIYDKIINKYGVDFHAGGCECFRTASDAVCGTQEDASGCFCGGFHEHSYLVPDSCRRDEIQDARISTDAAVNGEPVAVLLFFGVDYLFVFAVRTGKGRAGCS